MDFLFIDFVNSQWYNTHKTFVEPMKDSEWINNLLAKWDIKIDINLTEEYFRVLLDLRSNLVKCIEALIGKKKLDKTDIDLINHYLSSSYVKRTLSYDNEVYQTELLPTAKDLKWIVSEIVASFVKLLTEYDYNRLRVCENPDCKWVFYDESRSKTKRWCDSRCRNLIKVRRFREKQKSKK